MHLSMKMADSGPIPSLITHSNMGSTDKSLKTPNLKRRYMLKITPVEARGLLPSESGKHRNPYCTLVLLGRDGKEIRGEKQRTPSLKDTNPCWSPLKAEMLRCQESRMAGHSPLGLGAAAASEEYTFGKVADLHGASGLLVKCKDRGGLVEADDLGRIVVKVSDLDPSGAEQVIWYPLQLHLGGRMKRVQGEIRLATKLIREPSRRMLWRTAQQMLSELDIRDISYYLKIHPQCFTGKETVEWLLRHGLNRPTDCGLSFVTEEDAVLFGNSMIRARVIYHVSGNRDFVNSARQFYRFTVHHTDIDKQNSSLAAMTAAISASVDDDDNEEEGFCSLDMEPSDRRRNRSICRRSRLKIEDFQLLKVLGTGSFGKVLSARGPDGKIYAVKIATKIGMDDLMRRNVKRERDVMREVHHPFVATLNFAFQNEDKLYLGMDYFNGGDLRHHMLLHEKGDLALTPERVRFYAAELVAGIGHLHSLGIIYRDLKPENILIAKTGHIKLVDFGLAKIEDENSRAQSLVGTPEYIAPEILTASTPKSSSEGYDKSCDWWSLGILIFEMLVGRTPFKDANTAIMYRNIAQGALFVPPDLPETTKDLLSRLIERDLHQRLGFDEQVPFSIMHHPYFEGIDWDLLQAEEIVPPWIPDVVDGEDTKYVDSDFANQVAADTPEWRMLDSVDRQREHFDDFSFRTNDIIPK